MRTIRRGPRGVTLLELVIALAVLAIGVTALQGLVARSLGTLAADAEASRALAVARSLLAEAALSPPDPGRADGRRDGLRFQRDVLPSVHPALREVHVHVDAADGGGCDLVEVIRVPPA